MSAAPQMRILGVRVPRALEAHVRPFAMYAATGVFSGGLNLLLTWGLTELGGLDPRVSYAGTLAVLLVINFFIGRHLIFTSTGGSATRQFLRFAGTSGTARLLEWCLFSLLVTQTPLHYLLVTILVLGTSFCVKYAVYRQFVFAKAAA